MAEAVQVGGDRGPHGWTKRDVPAIDHALHVIGVGTVAFGAAVPLMSHPSGMGFAMGVFALAGLIPIAMLHWNMIRSLIRDEEVAKCKERIRILEESGRKNDERIRMLEERYRERDERDRERDERIGGHQA